MNNRMTLEVIAPTVEEAIEKGLDQLGLEIDDVDVEVLDEGKRNLFRFAARQARIKLTVKSTKTDTEVIATEEVISIPDDDEDDYAGDSSDVEAAEEEEEEDDIVYSDQELDYDVVKARDQEIVKKLLQLMKTYAVATVDLQDSEDDDRQFV
ncbi:MAG: Jag N-terminal domain-containing protein, partial [Anaerolineaceae bacterium]|nr:Jag N-terminal domain-containing protein [Anaerolineaceae bacterium]